MTKDWFHLTEMTRNYDSACFHRAPAGWKELGKSALRRLPPKFIAWKSSVHPGVALTFDDGPDPYTPRILDILSRFHARATFFLIGERVAGNEEIVQRIAQEGHEIGNHSFSHPRFETLTLRHATAEVRCAQSVLEKAAGRSPGLFRPPRGKLCAASFVSAWRNGLSLAMWSIDLKDFCANSPREIMARLKSNPIRRGDIVLYHGTNESALAALPKVIEHASAAGGPLVSISELIGEREKS